MSHPHLSGRSWRGRLAELVASAWLQAHGWAVLSRRARIAGVEVDLVARRGRLALVVEVKSRGSSGVHVPAADLVSAAQRIRLQRAAGALARRHDGPVRIDLVEIRWGAWPLVRWHRGPWQP